MGLAFVALVVGATPGGTAAAGEPSEAVPSNWHVRMHVVPPLARVVLPDGGELLGIEFGRVGLGVQAGSGLWLDSALGALGGRGGPGWDATLVAGATLGSTRPSPGAWVLTTPLFVGYRYARRPGTRVADGFLIFEDMNMVVFGAREMLTRWSTGRNGLEIGLELSGAVPFTRDIRPAGSGTPSPSGYYDDPPTRFSLGAVLLVGWLVEWAPTERGVR